MKLSPLVLLLIGATGCGVGGGSRSDAPGGDETKPARHRVAVIDTGFDIDNEVFKKNLVKAWDVRCQETRHPFEQLSGATRYEELKKNFLDYLVLRKGCTIEKKLNNEISSEFANIAGVFNDWNSAIKTGSRDQMADRAAIESILSGENGKFNYHGTATAGLIAEKNEKIDLHIISINLARIIMYNDVVNRTCRSQAEMDLKIQLFEDADVRAAFIDPSREDADTVIAAALKEHGVTIINESYGPTSIGEFKKFYAANGCKEVNFEKMILAESKITRDREKAVEDRFNYRPLHVKAAGNAGEVISEIRQTLDPCVDNDMFLMVGSLDAKDEIPGFSNTGRCVEVYALGANVKTQAPKDFLNVQDGTSFSAPLVVRYLTMNTEPGTSPDDLKKFVAGKIDEKLRLKLGDWNRDFVYQEMNPVPNPNPNPNPNPQPGVYKAGWTAELVDGQIKECVQQLGRPGAAEYCDCAIKGLALTYTTDEIAAIQVETDPIVLACRQQFPIQ